MLSLFERGSALRLASAIVALTGMISAPVLPAFAQGAQAEEQVAAPLSRGAIERLVAPIALYPDKLLTHVLMASTYPYEVVQAARWRSGHAGLKGDDLEDALKDEPWDSSVKAIVAVPDVLTMMDQKLDWTQQLGEAFLAQEKDVFDAVQDLRARARTAGNLKSSKELRVERIAADNGTYYETIEPVVENEYYVPVYDPLVVYGPWPYPDYQPYYWYPPGYRRDAVIWFGAAALIGVAMWAAWDWRRRSIIVNPVKFNAFNKSKFANPVWKFAPQHRVGTPFKLPVLNNKFGPVKSGPGKVLLQPNNKTTGGGKFLPHTITKPGTPKVDVTKNLPKFKPNVTTKTVTTKTTTHTVPHVKPKVDIHKNMPKTTTTKTTTKTVTHTPPKKPLPKTQQQNKN